MSGTFDRRTMLRTGAAATAMGVVAGGAHAAATAARTSLRARLQAEIEAYLATRRKAEGITAVSAYVSRSASDPGIAVATGSTGRSSGVAIDDRTLFEIGSNTKAFTSALLMKLEAAGRLDIDQTVGDWLPQYPAWGKVKIRRLLNMTSGIPTYSEAPRFMRAQAENRFRHFTPKELVAYAYPTPDHQLPTSTGYFYSNTNYVLAGMIVAKAGGATYDQQLRQRIFKPLGMHDTFYDSWKLPDSVITRMAHGYFENPTCSEYRPDCTVGPLAPLAGKDMRDADVSWTGAAGGIVSTPRDLARWIRGIFGGLVVPPAQLAQMKQLVSTRTGKPIARATAQDPGGFGLGLAQSWHPRLGRFWLYEGVTLGYRGVFAWFPSDDLVLAAALNSQPLNGTDQVSTLMETIYNTVMR